MLRWYVAFVFALIPLGVVGQALDRQPVIDVHLHAMSLDALRDQGPSPVTGTASSAYIRRFPERCGEARNPVRQRCAFPAIE